MKRALVFNIFLCRVINNKNVESLITITSPFRDTDLDLVLGGALMIGWRLMKVGLCTWLLEKFANCRASFPTVLKLKMSPGLITGPSSSLQLGRRWTHNPQTCQSLAFLCFSFTYLSLPDKTVYDPQARHEFWFVRSMSDNRRGMSDNKSTSEHLSLEKRKKQSICISFLNIRVEESWAWKYYFFMFLCILKRQQKKKKKTFKNERKNIWILEEQKYHRSKSFRRNK